MCNMVFIGPHPATYFDYLDGRFGPLLVQRDSYEITGAVRPNQVESPLLIAHEVGQGEIVARRAWFNIVDPWQVKWPASGEAADWVPAIDYKKNPSRQNARDDKLAETKTWVRLMRRHRCLVLASGFAEWQWQDKEGAPLADFVDRPKRAPQTQIKKITFPDYPVIALPGMWNSFEVQLDGRDPFDWVSCSIITTGANTTMQAIHNKSADPSKRRQPAWLNLDDQQAWLDTESVKPEQAASLLRQFSPEMMQVVSVEA